MRIGMRQCIKRQCIKHQASSIKRLRIKHQASSSASASSIERLRRVPLGRILSPILGEAEPYIGGGGALISSAPGRVGALSRALGGVPWCTMVGRREILIRSI
jgi:hypothetical protein